MPKIFLTGYPCDSIPSMALIPCPDCGKSISKRAISCPGCGREIQYWTAGRIMIAIVLIALLFGFAIQFHGMIQLK
jgi:hypothetical protein